MAYHYALLLLATAFFRCTSPTETVTTLTDTTDTDTALLERYRLAYHFSPEKNWMNDPNGLVYHQGLYHLFYQYNPEGTKWGNMSWGHAITQDLAHWTHLPLAIPMDDSIMIFSGSAVVDQHNTSGLCEGDSGCLVAVYTAHQPELQTQAIAYSNDNGSTWTQYEGNPVLNENMKDFRDPKVFWYEEGKKWVMAVAVPQEQKVRFYESNDLINWRQTGSFGPEGFTDGIWECPDLFALPIEEGASSQWVLLVSHNTPDVGSTMQYFVGNFDGKKFTNANADDLVLSVDEGRDFYAGVTWNNAPQDRRLLIGWLNNWAYGQEIPTQGWRSAQSLVRILHLQKFPEGIRLVQHPVPELQELRKSVRHYGPAVINEGDDFLSLEDVRGTQLEIMAEFAYEAIETPADSDSLASEFGIKVFEGTDQETVIGYDVASQSLFVDRTRSGDTTFNASFATRTIALMPSDSGTVKMHIFVDRSSVEVFGNDGYAVMSNRIFPDPQQDGVEVYTIGGTVTLQSLDIWLLNNIRTEDKVKKTVATTNNRTE